MEPFTSLTVGHSVATKRDVKKVPFVELRRGRVQGVVSSGSDIRRVYVSFIERETGNFYCCTNNNRPCGGLRGGGCKHIQSMMKEAVVQFGAASVANYMYLDESECPDSRAILGALSGTSQKESSGEVFSHFLNYLRFCELESQAPTVREMAWFVQ